MKLNKDMNILIVGLGLIGGSYARALRKKGFKVGAVAKRQSSVDYALKEGIIDYGTTEISDEIVGNADLIVFALYPHIFIEWIREYGQLIKSGTIITDVTGVKGCIVKEVQAMLPAGVEYIAAHPMAGKEVYGVENSDDSIFKQANYIVVPTENNTPDAIELCTELGRTLGFKQVSQLSVSEHDEMIAFLSQLTHCIAVSLMCCNDREGLEFYTGDSFRDLTRIARINDEMWSELFLLNKQALLNEMNRFRSQFDLMYNAIKNGDREGLRDMMKKSTERRGRFDKK